ncbi:MAG: hypothetical protein JW732_00070 [Dehalococcoidia bacterium]|nr:hypothetical protein [Dehalococcoidia bacterium]
MSKKVLCSDCGFLCWDISDVRDEFGRHKRWGEVFQHNRKDLAAGSLKATDDDFVNDESFQLSCLRHQWIFLPGNKDPRHKFVGLEDIRKLRNCEYYFKYVPASGPEEHKELKREWDNRKAVRNATLIGAGIGALAAIIAQILYAIITG